MTAAISRGRLLSQEEWNVIEKACGVAVELRDARERVSLVISISHSVQVGTVLRLFALQIFAYVESRMNILAPNVSNIISTTIAAKLLGVAGGLSAFAKTPSCNLYVSCDTVQKGIMLKLTTCLSSSYLERSRRVWLRRIYLQRVNSVTLASSISHPLCRALLPSCERKFSVLWPVSWLWRPGQIWREVSETVRSSFALLWR